VPVLENSFQGKKELVNVGVEQKLKDIKSGKLKAAENIKQFLKKIEREDKKINSFLFINKNSAKEAEAVDQKKKKSRLAPVNSGLAPRKPG